METALSGVRILDLSRQLAGPYCTMIVANLGAEIIKIEPVSGRTEPTGPYSYKGQDAYFMSVNRSKKSITLDLRTDKGREVFYDLVRISNVVFNNFRPSVPERLPGEVKRTSCHTVSFFGQGENPGKVSSNAIQT